jgi:hypothetical protein
MQLAEIGHQPVQFLIGQCFQRRTKNRAQKVADKSVSSRPPMQFFLPWCDLISCFAMAHFGLDLSTCAEKGLEDIGASRLIR